MTKGFFSPKRFSQLLFRDFISAYRGALIAMAAVAGSVLFIAVMTALGTKLGGGKGPEAEFYYGFFGQVLMLGGLIVSSLAFREAHRGGRGIFYMTIPSSAFEKLASKLLVTSVGYAAGTLLFFTVLSAVCEGAIRLIFGFGFGFFNPVSSYALWSVAGYLIVQSMFLLGSLWFKKTAFVKTSLWLALFGVATLAIAALAVWIFFARDISDAVASLRSDAVSGASFDWSQERFMQLFGDGSAGRQGLEVFFIVLKVMVCGLLAPACWLASYFRLKEIEV